MKVKYKLFLTLVFFDSLLTPLYIYYIYVCMQVQLLFVLYLLWLIFIILSFHLFFSCFYFISFILFFPVFSCHCMIDCCHLIFYWLFASTCPLSHMSFQCCSCAFKVIANRVCSSCKKMTLFQNGFYFKGLYSVTVNLFCDVFNSTFYISLCWYILKPHPVCMFTKKFVYYIFPISVYNKIKINFIKFLFRDFLHLKY